MPLRYLITGATGFVGSHLSRACKNYGYQVVTIARASSNLEPLREFSVAVHQGDLGDPRLAAQALDEIDVVVHSAADTRPWAGLDEYRKTNVEGLRHLLNACKGHALERFVHISCSTVYANRHHFGSNESEPLPRRHRDANTQSKMEAEQLALKYYRDFGVPVVVLRPGLVYGPRERHIMPWLIERLRNGELRYFGAKGSSALDPLFVRNLVDAIFLAVDNPQAVGNVYNLNDGEYVSKRRFVEVVAEALDVPAPRSTRSLWSARWRTWCAETLTRLRGGAAAPSSTWAQYRLLGLNLDFSIERAREQLGYRPRVSFTDGMAETMAWYKSQADSRKIIEARISDAAM